MSPEDQEREYVLTDLRKLKTSLARVSHNHSSHVLEWSSYNKASGLLENIVKRLSTSVKNRGYDYWKPYFPVEAIYDEYGNVNHVKTHDEWWNDMLLKSDKKSKL